MCSGCPGTSSWLSDGLSLHRRSKLVLADGGSENSCRVKSLTVEQAGADGAAHACDKVGGWGSDPTRPIRPVRVVGVGRSDDSKQRAGRNDRLKRSRRRRLARFDQVQPLRTRCD